MADPVPRDDAPVVRTGQGSTKLTKDEFRRRIRERFNDPAFDGVAAEIDRVVNVAWEGYDTYRKNPRTRKAGPGFSDPEFELPVEWLDARDRIREAESRHKDPAAASRILLICASPRTDDTCPGEMSKTFRLTRTALEAMTAAGGVDVDLLDLSRLTSEYGRVILPCKACVATAMPLCHWPCSCYPNHAMGQVNDWMNELYPRWVAAHGVMIVSPVHWYGAPSVLKLMMDRLHDWLTDMELVPAGAAAVIDRYVGYYEPYATSHEALDRDTALLDEVRNASGILLDAVHELRAGRTPPGHTVKLPRPK